MTISGCSKGNPGGLLLHANFNADQADAFAEYATEVIQYFHDNWNIIFQYYEPFNEPMGLAGLYVSIQFNYCVQTDLKHVIPCYA